MKRYFLAIVLLGLSCPIFAATIHVPGDYAAIQEAIIAAAAGDTVLVAPGTYVENLDFLGKAITVKSSGGAAATVIDGGSPADPDFGSVVSFRNGEGPDSVLEGFTLQGGSGTQHSWGLSGGGIFCLNSTPEIRQNVLRHNAAQYGGGIYCEASTGPTDGPVVRENAILENTGDGFYCYVGRAEIQSNHISANAPNGLSINHANPEITGNLIEKNAGAGIWMDYSSYPEISGNLIQDNISPGFPGGGIYCSWSKPSIHDNLILRNSWEGRGGGIFCGHGADAEIRNNILWMNHAAWGGGLAAFNESNPKITFNTFVGNTATVAGGGVHVETNSGWPPKSLSIRDNILWQDASPAGAELCLADATVDIDYCDLAGGLSSISMSGSNFTFGDHMVDADPLFADPAAGDFRLRQDPCQPGVVNPCVDAGSTFAMNLNMLSCSTRTDGGFDQGKVDLGMHIGSWSNPVWRVDKDAISAAAGGNVLFTLEPAGASLRKYLILGSVTGVSPGIPLPGGLVELPLTWDPFTDLVLAFLNTPVFQDFYGIYPYQETATLSTGPIPGAAGVSLYFAYMFGDPFDFASHPMRIDIVP